MSSEQLSEILLASDCEESILQAVESGEMDLLVPELTLLSMEQDPIHKHKDVLAHTIAVVSKTEPEITVRLGALFHDIGKPKTRSFEHGGVTFRHHEVVGSRMARKRLGKLGYPEQVIDEVVELVRLSGRFKGYADGWSDSAVRRYARDAGPLLGKLNHLIRCDCTTRNENKARGVQEAMDDLERRIAALAEEDRQAAERPGLNGLEVMEYLDIRPGPEVAEALAHLLEIKRNEGDLDLKELQIRLDAWWKLRNKESDEY